MQLRTFLAKDMPGALAQVRRDMGSEAVILSTEVMEDGQVLVRAALDEASAYDDVTFSDAAPDPVVSAYGSAETSEDEAEVLAQLQAVCAAASDVVRANTPDGGKRAPKQAVAPVRQVIPAPARQTAAVREAKSAVEMVARQAIAAAGARAAADAPPEKNQTQVVRGGAGLLASAPRGVQPRSPAPGRMGEPPVQAIPPRKNAAPEQGFDRAALLKIFARHRLPEALARALTERAMVSGIHGMKAALTSALDERMHVNPIDYSRTSGILLTGLGGVGKTATAAKMAAHAQLAGRDVCLIAADIQGAGAVERLSAFASHLRAECIPAESDAVAQRLVRTAQERGVLPIIDTAGCDPRVQVDTLGAATRGVEIVGVVSAMSDSEEMGEITTAMRYYEISRLIITQADMTRRFGAVVSAALASGMGLAHITRSPFVADGLEQLSPEGLAQLLVESKEDSVQ